MNDYSSKRKNRNRGYQQLTVWQDAISLYRETSTVFAAFKGELLRVGCQQIASVDSVHRNIAEGYCRRSRKEYLHFLNIALGSLGESVSGLIVYSQANQLRADDFERLDALAYKLENGLLKLVEALELKRDKGEWTETLIREADGEYRLESEVSHITPSLHPPPKTPRLQYSNTKHDCANETGMGGMPRGGPGTDAGRAGGSRRGACYAGESTR